MFKRIYLVIVVVLVLSSIMLQVQEVDIIQEDVL